ncbi:unnamed protein product [Brachionus calyciflorus]|uniref:Uncharacterized protein n=1 Tax=Brachionus calyciflorus TaxID=104777 RepID=A0A813RZY0_9BILA|nr:unnamed protein product [Brachionus calyciflorus]
MWNHFDKEGYPRTNNYLEGYNNKLSNHLSVPHSDIYKAISKFQEEESDASLKYYRALNNEKASPRKKLNVINDSILNIHRQMLRNDEISIDAYTKYIVMMFDVNSIDKNKKKNQEDLISTASEHDSIESELEEFSE